MRVQIGARSFVERDRADSARLSRRDAIFISQAGDIAERWVKRHKYLPLDCDYAEFIGRVRSGCYGACDGCQAASAALADVAFNGDPQSVHSDAATIGVMREVEQQAIDILTSRPVTHAIAALADRLMVDGTVDGETAHAILSQFITFGSARTGNTHD